MKSNEHIKKFPPGEIPKCAKNQIWEAGDKNWSLGPASTGSMQKPGQPTSLRRAQKKLIFATLLLCLFDRCGGRDSTIID